MTQPPDILDDPQRAAPLLLAAADEANAASTDAITDLLAPYLAAGVRVDDWAPVIRELGRSLRSTHNALRTAEEQFATRDGALVEACHVRTEAIAALREQLQAARAVVGAVFGPAELKKTALDEEIPNEAMSLVRMASQVSTKLSYFIGFPALRRGLALSERIHHAPLGGALHALASAMAAVRSSERAQQHARTARIQAQEAFELRAREAVRTLDELMRRAVLND